MKPEDQAAAEELAEVKQLQRQQLMSKIRVPGLQIEELHGELHLVFHRMLNYGKFLLHSSNTTWNLQPSCA